MSNEPVTEDSTPDLARRSLGLGVLGLLGAGLAAKPAEAFPPSAGGEFNAATRILSRYGVKVSGDSSEGHDVIAFDMQPLADTEYRQIIPCVKTAVLNDTAVFTHTHPGEIVPCIKTTIHGHELATTEVFDAAYTGSKIGLPALTLSAQMEEDGVIGAVTLELRNVNQDLVVYVGDKTYRLVDGALVLDGGGSLVGAGGE